MHVARFYEAFLAHDDLAAMRQSCGSYNLKIQIAGQLTWNFKREKAASQPARSGSGGARRHSRKGQARLSAGCSEKAPPNPDGLPSTELIMQGQKYPKL